MSSGIACLIGVIAILFPAPVHAGGGFTLFFTESLVTAGNAGRWSAMDLDSEGRAHIVYFDEESGSIFYTRYEKSTLQFTPPEIIQTAGEAGWYNSIAVDSGGIPHVTYYVTEENRADAELWYAVRNRPGDWVRTLVSSADTLTEGSWSSLTVDEQGNPHIAYCDNDSLNLEYAFLNGDLFIHQTVDSSEFAGFECQLVLDSEGKAHISYTNIYDDSINVHYVTNESGDWERVRVATLDLPSDNGIGWSSIAIDDQNDVYIAWVESTEDMIPGQANLYFAARESDFNPELVDDAGIWGDSRPVSIDVSRFGPIIAYYVLPEADLNLAVRITDDQWEDFDFDTEGDVGEIVTLRLDTLGFAQITYYDKGNGDLKYLFEAELLELTVEPANDTIETDEILEYTATGRFRSGVWPDADFESEVASIWKSTSISIATISSEGEALGLTEGTTSIIASRAGCADTTDLTVMNAPAVTPNAIIFPLVERRWDMVSFPLAPETAGERSITAIMDTLGPFNDKTWKVGHWSPADEAYEDLVSATDMTETGAGYWMITDGSVDSLFTPWGFYPEGDVSVSLASGPGGAAAWNQIGFPHNGTILTNDLLVTDGIDTVQVTSSENDLTDRTVQSWFGDQYLDLSGFGRGVGFWIRKLTDGPAHLIFPIDAVQKYRSIEPMPVSKPVDADWAISIRATTNEAVGAAVLVGVSNDAGNKWNPLSRALPPHPPDGGLRLYLPHHNWGAMSGDYVHDFVPPARSNKWEIVLSGVEGPGEVLIRFISFDLPEELKLTWVNKDTGSRVPVDPDGSVLVAATGLTKHFTLIASLDSDDLSNAAAGKPRFMHAYPSPFQQSVGFRFHLPGSADLAVTIYTPAGREVRHLERRGASAGENVLLWDGRDERGRALAAGVYLARHRAGNQTVTHRIVMIR